MNSGPAATLRVDADAVLPMPWRNGGGVTRELLRIPPATPHAAADDWLLRVSLADISADGAFSAFEGITRWFTVISGAGVRLTWPASEHVLHVQDPPLEFDGGDAPWCALLDGATRDLNVMVRRDAASARLTPAAFGTSWRWDGTERGIFTLQPLMLHLGRRPQHAAAGSAVELPARSLVWCSDGDASAWSIAKIAEIPGGTLPLHQAAGGAAEAPVHAPPAVWIGLRLNASRHPS
jgi:environmental stress-induced protein Ves